MKKETALISVIILIIFVAIGLLGVQYDNFKEQHDLLSDTAEKQITIISHLKDSIRQANEVHTYLEITSYEVQEPLRYSFNGRMIKSTVTYQRNTVSIIKRKKGESSYFGIPITRDTTIMLK